MGHCIVLVNNVSDKVMGIGWLVAFSVCMFGSVSVYLLIFGGMDNWIQMSTFFEGGRE
jgi:hypothetical protein